MNDVYTRITAANMHDYPVGTRIRHDYGVMHGEEFSKVVGHQTGNFGSVLIVQFEGRTEQTSVSSLTNEGLTRIGTYLAELAEKKVDTSSPWYRAD